MAGESKPGSLEYARELAGALEAVRHDGLDGLGPTDTAICAAALRYHADRWRRRAVLGISFAFVAAAGAGLPHVAMAAKAAAGMIMPG